MLRRVLSLAAVAAIVLVATLTLLRSGSLTREPGHNVPTSDGQHERPKDVSRTDLTEVNHEGDPNAWRANGHGAFKEPKVQSETPYAVGKTKPTGSEYTRCLVVPVMQNENVTWIDDNLRDMIESGLLKTAIYSMDDPTAALHPVANKGNEAMAYLSYIIDFHDDLPDVVMFMHSHRYAWHNNPLLEKDAALMVRHLSPERVTREGYMNMRCHWYPGCPEWIHPGVEEHDESKTEADLLAEVWPQLFPDAPIPAVLAQPCCAQFAVSRERIRAIPEARFVSLQDWILNTELSDFISGRILEYTWQYIFTSSTIHCPSMSACYCDGYGLCFGGPEEFDRYFELDFYHRKYTEELTLWNEEAAAVEVAREKASSGRLNGEEMLTIPDSIRGAELVKNIAQLSADMKASMEMAFERGKDPKQRAKEARRPWSEGGGF